MGATASVNANSKKYKTSEPIEVKFHNVVKYDDGDEKPFRDKNHQLVTKKHEPLSLLACAIRILEKKPKGEPIPNGHLPKQYARQVRPRSAYMVLKKNGSQPASSTYSTPHNSPEKHSPGKKQEKTKQKLYMSLINPARLAFQGTAFPHNGMTAPHRTHPPTHFPLTALHPKSSTLPRSRNEGGNKKRVKVNRQLYLDMISPMMSSPQYYKLGGNRSAMATPSTQRTIHSRQSQALMAPRPPTASNQFQKRLHPNILKNIPPEEGNSRPEVLGRRGIYTPRTKTPTPQTSIRSTQSSSIGNGFIPHREKPLFPRITTKTRDDVSLNSRTRGQIPQTHPENVVPLYFRKSLAYSPQYKRKELMSNPLL